MRVWCAIITGNLTGNPVLSKTRKNESSVIINGPLITNLDTVNFYFLGKKGRRPNLIQSKYHPSFIWQCSIIQEALTWYADIHSELVCSKFWLIKLLIQFFLQTESCQVQCENCSHVNKKFVTYVGRVRLKKRPPAASAVWGAPLFITCPWNSLDHADADIFYQSYNEKSCAENSRAAVVVPPPFLSSSNASRVSQSGSKRYLSWRCPASFFSLRPLLLLLSSSSRLLKKQHKRMFDTDGAPSS